MAALAAGTDNRPVTTKEIQAHLDDFALAKEFSVYGKIGGLSGGQKVRVCGFPYGGRWGDSVLTAPRVDIPCHGS